MVSKALKHEFAAVLPVFADRMDRALERDISAVFTLAVKLRLTKKNEPTSKSQVQIAGLLCSILSWRVVRSNTLRRSRVTSTARTTGGARL